MVRTLQQNSIWWLSLAGLVLAVACAKKEVRTAEGTGGNASLSAETTAPAAPVTAPEVDEKNDLTIVHFDFNQSTLTHEAKKTLKDNAQWLKKNPKVRVKIEGHCDERGSEEYNMKLGQKRADAVKQFLRHAGIAGNRLSTTSFGKDKPVDTGQDESAWAKNRRAAFRIVAQ
jgi:peptidoglycan-associated lipoprotein